MSKVDLQIIYRNYLGRVILKKIAFIVSADKTYLKYYDAEKREPRTILRSRILEFIEDPDSVESLLDSYGNDSASHTNLKDQNYYRVVSKKWNLDEIDDTLIICFTGFRKQDKERLTKIAKENGFNVCTRPSKYLNMLVCGYNSSKSVSKKRIAKEVGAKIISESQFLEYVSTGRFTEDDK